LQHLNDYSNSLIKYPREKKVVIAHEVNCVVDALKNNDALIVAFASMDNDMVDQHFGSASAFFVYEISEGQAECIAQQSFGHEKKDGNEDKLKPKLAWLMGCDIVYCGSIGGSATRQLITLGVNPIQVKGGPDIEEIIEELQSQLKDKPPFWLANILKQKQRQDQSRFELMANEGWDG
jgi:nitrogen fixation protein NifX|tara:strand:- start:162 stop:695 length:534 start_codon:yes stop_codon:yes gene_type:complete